MQLARSNCQNQPRAVQKALPALDPVSGHATPERQPPDDRVPRLIMDDGNLVVSVP